MTAPVVVGGGFVGLCSALQIRQRGLPVALVDPGEAERGLDTSSETIRRWVLRFGPAAARRLRRLRPKPSPRWHLDEVAVRIAGGRMHLWRAVDDEGEVLDVLVQRRRDKHAARKLMRKLLIPAALQLDLCPGAFGDGGDGFVYRTRFSGQ